MDATFLAGSPKNGGIGVHDGEFVLVLRDRHVRVGCDSDDGEKCTVWFPALRASARVVVEDIALEFDFDGIRLAMAA